MHHAVIPSIFYLLSARKYLAELCRCDRGKISNTFLSKNLIWLVTPYNTLKKSFCTRYITILTQWFSYFFCPISLHFSMLSSSLSLLIFILLKSRSSLKFFHLHYFPLTVSPVADWSREQSLLWYFQHSVLVSTKTHLTHTARTNLYLQNNLALVFSPPGCPSLKLLTFFLLASQHPYLSISLVQK